MPNHSANRSTLASRSKRFSRLAAGFVILVGTLVLIGWQFDLPQLKGVYAGITMKANAALSLVLAGVSLWLLGLPENKVTARKIGQVCAVLLAAIGALTLSQHVFGWDLHIDQLLFTEAPGARATASPGRMGVPASSCFTICGLALLLFYRRRGEAFAQALTIIIGLWAMLAILGYAYQAEALYGIARYSGIALHTAVAFFVLSLGMLAANPDRGLTSIICHEGAGGMMARRLLFTATTVPFLLGWLRLVLQRAGYVDLGFGTALFVVAVVIIFVSVIGLTAGKLNRIEREVNIANERFTLAEIAANGFVYDWDLEAGKVERSEGISKVLGFKQDEANPGAEWWSNRIHPEDLEQTLRTCRTAIESGADNWSIEFRVRHKEGHYIHVWDHGLLMRDNGGRATRVVGSTVDISQLRIREQQLAEQARLLDLSFDAIIVRDDQDRIKYWSRGAEAAYGFTREEALGKSLHELLRTEFPEPLELITEKLQRDGRWVGEVTHSHKDGSKIIDTSRWALDRNPMGQAVSILETNNDITARKRAEEDRERLLVQEQDLRAVAERANRLKDEFLATVSHELRTPLNAILGWSTMLRGGKLDAAGLARAGEVIERNAKSQAQLIEDLLDVSRIISGKQRLDVKPVGLTSVLKAAVDSVQPAADAKEIQLHMIVDPAADGGNADAARLQQVVWNLLSNSIKFTPKGGHVTITLERTDSMTGITVTDTGEGISAEFMPHIFDRFKQADGSITRKHGGLGLGLAIARHLIEMHGGTIEAESPGLGLGATFRINLPAARKPVAAFDSAGVASLLKPPGSADLTEMKGVRVLVVDDDADAREMLRIVLEQLGVHVTAASSVKDALDVLPASRPDLIVSDIGMPYEDGFSLIEKVRALSRQEGGDIPAIALSGYSRVEERMRALAAGYQMFVPKPVEIGELAKAIASLLGRAENTEVVKSSKMPYRIILTSG